MSWIARFTGQAKGAVEVEELDSTMTQALDDFKASVHAWGGTMANRPRTATRTSVHRSWRLAVGTVTALVLIAGAGSGGFYEHQQRQEKARMAATREAEHQRELAAERAQATEKLFANVDSDVSQEVPDAMEPLAALSSQNESR